VGEGRPSKENGRNKLRPHKEYWAFLILESIKVARLESGPPE
jgi:hypothetical protein